MDDKPHVLVLPYPAQGHINPMLQFSKRLLSKGLKTTLATTLYIAKSMPPPNSLGIDLQTISDGFDDTGFAGAGSIQEYLASLHLAGTASLATLITKLGVTAIVYDGFLPWVLDVAKRFGITTVVFFTQSCAVNSVYYHYHVNRNRNWGVVEEGRVKVPGVPLLGDMEVPSFLKEPESYPAYYDLVVNGQFSNVDQVDWVLYNTFYKLEEEVVEWASKVWRVRTIGPTIPSMYLDKRVHTDTDYGINMFNPMTKSCTKWLNTKPPASVVYVSFGSMAGLDSNQTLELATCIKQSHHHFLWVVRQSDQPKLPKDFPPDAGQRVLVVTWAPQLEVLSHASVACFVTHCGLNSVLEALSLGVPAVAMPQWSDQRTNGKYVEDVWGVGVRVRVDGDGIVRACELERCVTEIMEGERGDEVRRNATEWRKLAREAVDEGGSSDRNIDELVASLRMNKD